MARYYFGDDILDDVLNFSTSDEYDDSIAYNQYIDEEKNLYFEFALTGIPKNLIEITKKNKIIKISIKDSKSENKFEYAHKGIMHLKNNTITFEVFDDYEDEPEITYVDGMLKFKFNIKPQEKSKILSIN